MEYHSLFSSSDLVQMINLKERNYTFSHRLFPSRNVMLLKTFTKKRQLGMPEPFLILQCRQPDELSKMKLILYDIFLIEYHSYSSFCNVEYLISLMQGRSSWESELFFQLAMKRRLWPFTISVLSENFADVPRSYTINGGNQFCSQQRTYTRKNSCGT